jgi:hypothetical protein
MILEILFIVLLVFGVCVVAYRGAIHEFQVLQKDYALDTKWSEMISEQLPIVIRSLPNRWLGAWTQQRTEQKTWVVVVEEDGKKFRTTWANWLQNPKGVPQNLLELASVAKLDTTLRNWTDEGFTHWSWLPTSTPLPAILTDQQYTGVKKTTAEYTAIVATDGAPLELWIAHEGAIPEKVTEDLRHRNPWTQTTEDIPWIGEVKFMEIKLRPGNTVILPRHWWYAVRVAEEKGSAWYWTAQFHTPISQLVSLVQRSI